MQSPTPRGVKRLPFALWNLTQLAFLFVHYPTTRRLPRILSFIILLVLIFYSYTEYSLQSPGEDYIIGCGNGILLLAAVHMTFLCPEFPNGFRRTGSTTKHGSTPSKLPFAQKLGWMVGLASNMRWIGFSRGGGAMDSNAPADANVDKRGPVKITTRIRFVITRIILAVLCLAMFHLILLYRLISPSFNPTFRGDANDGKFILAHPSLLRRSMEIIVWVLSTVSEMTFIRLVAAVLLVGVGASRPEDWPPMFGSPTHAYSVRRFWSKTWHQLLRVPLERSGAYMAQGALKLDKGTAAFALVRSITAFFLSALVHVGGDYAIHRTLEKSGPTFQFFLLQPAAILIEEIAIRGARCVIPTRVRIPGLVWKLVGYLWVGLWFTWCTPPWLDAISAARGNLRTKLIPLKMFEEFTLGG